MLEQIKTYVDAHSDRISYDSNEKVNAIVQKIFMDLGLLQRGSLRACNSGGVQSVFAAASVRNAAAACGSNRTTRILANSRKEDTVTPRQGSRAKRRIACQWAKSVPPTARVAAQGSPARTWASPGSCARDERQLDAQTPTAFARFGLQWDSLRLVQHASTATS